MSKAKWIWLGALGALYVAFWIWHGGNGTRIGPEEAEEMLAQLEKSYGFSRNDPVGDNIEATFLRNMVDMLPKDDGREFYAVNLEQLKGGEEARAADQRYARTVMPLILERGGYPVFVGDRAGFMLGDYGADVDRVAVVRYRSLRDMIDMALDPAMQAGTTDKFASLDHTEVLIVRPTISFVQMRVTVAAILVLVGLAGFVVIGRISGHQT